MPLLGLTACPKIEDYRQAVLHVGGEVHLVDHSMTPCTRRSTRIDGLLLTGGEDVAPSRYGEATHPSVVDVDAARDEFEIALVGEARRRNLPIFAICRGIQVLNVACGGTLVQDIPSEVPGALEHRWTVPPHKPYDLAHEVWVDKDTLLARLMRERLSDTDACEVEQPPSPGGQAGRGRVPRLGHRARRRHRGDRRSSRALLPRRPVAPGKLLAHRRVPAALRRLPRSRASANPR